VGVYTFSKGGCASFFPVDFTINSLLALWGVHANGKNTSSPSSSSVSSSVTEFLSSVT
jgi:hypothetical protein